MSRTIISLDTDHIKQYVFATGVLKEIRGASAILDELNRKGMTEAIKTVDPSFDQERDTIYANGGSGMFEVDADKADACIQAVERLYQDETMTGSLTGATHKFTNPTDPAVFQKDYRTLSLLLRSKKDAKAMTGKLVTHALFKTCDSCGDEYANVPGEQDKVICKSCHIKRKKDDEIKGMIKDIISRRKHLPEQPYAIWERLLKELRRESAFAGVERPDDLNILGELSSPSGYIGLLYADGNGMGKEIEQATGFEQLKHFSETVDEAIFKAVVEAIKQHLHPKPKTVHFPFDVLLLGGDDLVMVTVADKAIETAMMIEELFRTYTADAEKLNKPLTLSVGVAIAHAKFPFGNLLDLAESALKFAKKERAKRKRLRPGNDEEPGLINFQVVTANSSLDFKDDYRRIYSSIEETGASDLRLIRTLRPYYVAHPSDSRTLNTLISLIRKMKAAGFPKGKLQALQEIVFRDYTDSVLESMALHNRLKEKEPNEKKLVREMMQAFAQHQNNVLEPFLPWFAREKAYYSPFVDLAELYDFIN